MILTAHNYIDAPNISEVTCLGAIQQFFRILLELIEMADADLLDFGRSRGVEQQVLDILDEPSTG